MSTHIVFYECSHFSHLNTLLCINKPLQKKTGIAGIEPVQPLNFHFLLCHTREFKPVGTPCFFTIVIFACSEVKPASFLNSSRLSIEGFSRHACQILLHLAAMITFVFLSWGLSSLGWGVAFVY